MGADIVNCFLQKGRDVGAGYDRPAVVVVAVVVNRCGLVATKVEEVAYSLPSSYNRADGNMV